MGAAPKRRVVAAGGKSSGSTGLTASAVAHMLAGQSKLGKAPSKAAGSSSGSKAAAGSSRPELAGEIKQVNGRWVLTGFEADKRGGWTVEGGLFVLPGGC